MDRKRRILVLAVGGSLVIGVCFAAALAAMVIVSRSVLTKPTETLDLKRLAARLDALGYKVEVSEGRLQPLANNPLAFTGQPIRLAGGPTLQDTYWRIVAEEPSVHFESIRVGDPSEKDMSEGFGEVFSLQDGLPDELLLVLRELFHDVICGWNKHVGLESEPPSAATILTNFKETNRQGVDGTRNWSGWKLRLRFVRVFEPESQGLLLHMERDKIVPQLPAAAQQAVDAVAWKPKEHEELIRGLAGKMSREGFVWRSPAGEDQDVKDNPSAWEGNGDVFNPAWPRWRWMLVREGLPESAAVSRPQITLATRVAGHLPANLLSLEALGEIGRFEAELPAGSKQTLVRLARYAQELYDEDHVGTAKPPGSSRGTAQIDIRRKYGPRHSVVAVVDRLGRYEALVAIDEYAEPHGHLVSVSLRRPEK